MDREERELLRAIDRKVDAIQEESETYVAERSEVLARLEALRSDFEETRADVKAIATRIWRGNGGSSILERLASLETAVRDRGPALPAGSLRLWLLGGAMALVLSIALLAFTLGQENVRLLLDWLK